MTKVVVEYIIDLGRTTTNRIIGTQVVIQESHLVYSLLAAEIVQSELLMTDNNLIIARLFEELLPPNVRSSFEGQPPVNRRSIKLVESQSFSQSNEQREQTRRKRKKVPRLFPPSVPRRTIVRFSFQSRKKVHGAGLFFFSLQNGL